MVISLDIPWSIVYQYFEWIFSVVCALVVFLVNIPLIWIVRKTWNDSSLINKLIGLDSIVALLHIPFVLHGGGAIDINISCW